MKDESREPVGEMTFEHRQIECNAEQLLICLASIGARDVPGLVENFSFELEMPLLVEGDANDGFPVDNLLDDRVELEPYTGKQGAVSMLGGYVGFDLVGKLAPVRH